MPRSASGGVGMVAGGGPMARLPRQIGRQRAMEVLLSSRDIGGELAEAYGYVNRALPDAELDGFVDWLREIGSAGRKRLGRERFPVQSAKSLAETAPGSSRIWRSSSSSRCTFRSKCPIRSSV